MSDCFAKCGFGTDDNFAFNKTPLALDRIRLKIKPHRDLRQFTTSKSI